MVRALEQEQENYKSRLYHFKGMNDNSGGGQQQQARSFSSSDNLSNEEALEEERLVTRSQGSRSASDITSEKQHIGSVMSRADKEPKSRVANKAEAGPPGAKNSEMDQMKERFAKLLLGEDMSGGGKGVSSALALSNAITNLAASVFGEQSRLEPMSPDNKARWRREVDWLLSVSDHIVELVPSQQKNKDGSCMEIMVTRQRTDLHMNIPALRKLDTMLTDCYDNFKDQSEFYYVSKDAPDSEKGTTRNDKWWLPTVKVPPNGLSEASRKFLQYQKDCVNQVLKAAMAINAQVLSEMEVPENYIESLPKNGRASLGDLIYRSITVEYFDPDQFLSTMDLSSEHKILDLKNRIEASIVIWKRKMVQKDGKSNWGSAVSLEKRELFEERAETILLIIKQRFPGIPQSSLDISKIQFNLDVGQALLESYSRILESLAYTVMSRIEDVLYADYVTRNPSYAGKSRTSFKDTSTDNLLMMDDSSLGVGGQETSNSMTLSDFMGWNFDSSEEAKKDPGNSEETVKEEMKFTDKIANIVTIRKPSYLENLGGLRSPTARH
ncbi:Rop guanine nucleotide exchange factor 12 [Euphorbia peplus]|nr:Rop guanine nucleotide exchange factor 12 [Euphorbia peplus]